MELTQLSHSRCFEGVQQRFRHRSVVLACEMTFSIYLPPQALRGEQVPVIYWLSGLTCTDENFMQKAGAQRVAAALGLALVAPDTSPRGDHVPDDPDGAWDFGHGAGFYVDATSEPWRRHYQMHTYVVQELPDLLEATFPLDPQRRGISGHSMGGHGALVAALRHPDRYRSVSAFSPISHPSACPWGKKAFGHLLGEDPTRWEEWDAATWMNQSTMAPSWSGHGRLLVDQGSADPFLEEQLMPAALQAAAEASNLPLELRMQEGYDHSYFFVATFIEDHLQHHAQMLNDPSHKKL
ncbi:MAG: S-formylglutathione hydrolase [Cyanobacteriota bacterium]|nr:S-formylglutathione hydrolase [Cyanobacteriota bacterium]